MLAPKTFAPAPLLRPRISHSRIQTLFVLLVFIVSPLLAAPPQKVAAQDGDTTIEKQTKVHRLKSTHRSPFDAFVYLNRIPNAIADDETPQDLSGRIFSRLANQEGRILLKLPPGMDRQAYEGFKIFVEYEGTTGVGNCAACHRLPTLGHEGKYITSQTGKATVAAPLRNLKLTDRQLIAHLKQKLAASKSTRPDISLEMLALKLTDEDLGKLIAFLKTLQDVPDEKFRSLILDAEVLDTSGDIE